MSLATKAGAHAGIIAMQERSAGDAVDDAAIRFQIKELWFRHDEDVLRLTGLEVHEGRVLLTGVLPDAEHRDLAVRLAWQPDQVREVIDEIQVGDSAASDAAIDRWITAQLEAKLTFDGDVRAINYAVTTTDRVIYVLGVARDAAELETVVRQASGLRYVRRVVSHVRMADDPPTQDAHVPPVELTEPSAAGDA